MPNFLNSKLSSTSLSTVKSGIAGLIIAAICSTALNAAPVLALDPAATIRDFADTHDHIDVTWNSTTDGVLVGLGDVGAKITVNNAIDTATNKGVSVFDVGLSESVLVVLNANVKTHALNADGVEISLVGGLNAATVIGAGNIVASGRGINVNAVSVLIGGSGTITSGYGAISASGPGSISITHSGEMIAFNGSFGGGSGIFASLTLGDYISVVGIGKLTTSGTNGIRLVNRGTGNTVLNTSNAIVLKSLGNYAAVVTEVGRGLTNLTVADISVNAASIGQAVFLSHAANSTNGATLTLNGIVSGGDTANGYLAVKARGNAAVGFNMTNSSTGVLNGLVEATDWNTSTSLFTNAGIWNASGAGANLTSNFAGALNNTGTLNLQNNLATDIANFNGNITLGTNSIFKIDVTSAGLTDKLTTSAGNVVLNGTLNINATGAGYAAINNTVYTIIDNTGGGTLSGDFTSVTDNLAFLTAKVSKVGNDVTFKFVESFVTNTAGAEHNNVIPSAVHGLQVGRNDVGVKVVTYQAINATQEGIYVKDQDAGQTIEVIANHDVTTINERAVLVYGSSTSNVIFSGTGNLFGETGIALIGGAVTISGSGTITATGHSPIVGSSLGGAGDVNIQHTGVINFNSTVANIAAIYAQKNSGSGDINIVNSGIITINGDAKFGIHPVHNGTGDVFINVSNDIINNATGKSSGIWAEAATGAVEIHLGNVSILPTSNGDAILIENGTANVSDVNITLNGIITAGDKNNTSKVIGNYGTSQQKFTITNNTTGVMNGLVEVANAKTTSGFTNAGIWNAFGGTSNFAGAFSNIGTLNLQDDGMTDVAAFKGDITLVASSTLKVDVDNTGAGDKLTTTTGNVTLGGTLDVNATGAATGYDAASGKVYTLIDNTGTGTSTGTFATLTDNLAFLDLEVNAAGGDGNDVTFKFITPPVVVTPTTPTASTINFTPFATGQNQQNTANAMNGFDYTSAEGSKLYPEFLGLTNEQAKDAIKQISGGDHDTSSQSGAPIAAGFRSVLEQGSNGATSAAPQAQGFTVTASGDMSSLGMNVWAKAFGSYTNIKKGVNIADLRTINAGVVGGAEYAIGDVIIGAGAGYTYSSFSVQTAGSTSTANSFHLGGYGSWGANAATDTGFGISGGADVSLHQFKTRRNIVIGGITSTAAADYTGLTFGGTATVKYGFAVPIGDLNVVISPFAGIDGSFTSSAGFTETGAGALNITSAASNTKKLGTTIGLNLATKVNDIDLGVSVAYHREFGDVNQVSVQKLAGAAATFNSATPIESRNKINLQANAGFNAFDNGKLTFSAFGELSSTTVNVGASASLKFKF